MSDALIRKLYSSRIKSWADQNDYAVAFENATFDPPAAAYLELFIIPALTTSETVDGGHRSYRGVVQINIRTALNIGPGKAEGIAADLNGLFPVNLRLTDGSFAVQVITPAAKARGFPSGGTYLVPVSFRYRADTT